MSEKILPETIELYHGYGFKDDPGALQVWWKNPWDGSVERVAYFYWPSHPGESTEFVEKLFEEIARRAADTTMIPEARHKELMERAVREAKTEEWKAVADELEEIYGTSTGERMALIGHIRDTYKELKSARAASSTGAGEEKV